MYPEITSISITTDQVATLAALYLRFSVEWDCTPFFILVPVPLFLGAPDLSRYHDTLQNTYLDISEALMKRCCLKPSFRPFNCDYPVRNFLCQPDLLLPHQEHAIDKERCPAEV